jgi:NADH:ubiquinone oxidoreductase subunit 6 (subunit J)
MNPDLLTGLVFWLLAAVSFVAAAGVVFFRDVTRLAIALGVFLLAIAGWFVYYNQGFLAVAQVFVYVGGVLVLVLFAIMLVHRSEQGVPDLESRHSIDVVTVSVSVSALLFFGLRELPSALPAAPSGAPEALAEALLGPMLPHFEAAGLLLLAALVAAVVIGKGADR